MKLNRGEKLEELQIDITSLDRLFKLDVYFDSTLGEALPEIPKYRETL